MITSFLVRLFVRDSENTDSPAVRYAYGRLAGFTGLVCNLLLFALKVIVGFLAGSLAIVADAFNNLSDAGSGIVTLVGFKLSNMPADDDHPFGHGRIEYLSTMGVAVLIILAGFELASSAFDKIRNPVQAQFTWITFFILIAAIGIKLWMAFFSHSIGCRIQSKALLAAAVDSRNDVLCTGLVLISSLISHFTSRVIDGYIGLAVALFVMWSGFSIIKETVSPLLGQAPDPDLVENIRKTVLSYPGVVGIHDMIIHDYGPGRTIVSLHAEVPADQSIITSHDLIDNIETELTEAYHLLCCIHMDPVDTENPETRHLKAQVCTLLRSIDPTLSLHDFRVVPGDTHTNVLFDVVVPHHYPQQEKLEQRIREDIRRLDPKLNAVIKVENSFI